MTTSTCPCGLDQTYDTCCGRYIRGDAAPPTAEALMRSRYAAYVSHEIDYLVATHHPETRSDDHAALRRWAERAQWLGLEVLRTEDGDVNDETGIVEFRCRFFDGQPREHHERSSFAREQGRWVYVSGTFVEPSSQTVRQAAKVGRNAPCPCNSGKKYKRCCGAPGSN